MNYKRITVETLAKIAIALCSILAIAVLVNTFSNGVFEKVSYYGERITELEAQVAVQVEIIAEAEDTLAKNEKRLSSLKEAEKTAKTNYDLQETYLDAVCSRSEYHYRYCSSRCSSLHDAVSTAYSKYVTASNNRYLCENTISDLKDIIEEANSHKENLQGRFS